jgi:large subunit ribosomal protein L35
MISYVLLSALVMARSAENPEIRRQRQAAKTNWRIRYPSLLKIALASTLVAMYSLRSFAIEKLRIMRRPKGIKTKKSVSKRFKITGTGKVLRRHAGNRHLAQTKNPKRRRRLRSAVVVDATDAYRITQNLPFSH